MVLNDIKSVVCRGHSRGVDMLGRATEGVVRGRGGGGWWRVEEYRKLERISRLHARRKDMEMEE